METKFQLLLVCTHDIYVIIAVILGNPNQQIFDIFYILSVSYFSSLRLVQTGVLNGINLSPLGTGMFVCIKMG